MSHSVKEIAELLQLQLLASAEHAAATINGVASIESAGAADLVFVEDAKVLEQAIACRAGAVIAGEFAANGSHPKPILIASQPRLAFARAAALLRESPSGGLGVHPTAVVHPNAKIGLGVSVGAHSVIGDGVAIGARTKIASNVNIAAHVSIGVDSVLYSNVSIYSHTKIGDRAQIHSGAVLGSDGFGFVRDENTGKYEKFPQIGRLEIGSDVEIGANTTVDRGALDATVIGNGVKLDNLVHIGHNVQVGDNVVIAAQTGVSGSSVIEKNTIVAGQVGIADHVTIEEGAILGAQSGIPSGKVIRGKGVLFWGTPARPIKQYLKELAILARMAKK